MCKNFYNVGHCYKHSGMTIDDKLCGPNKVKLLYEKRVNYARRILYNKHGIDHKLLSLFYKLDVVESVLSY